MEYDASDECCTCFAKMKLKCQSCFCCHSLEEWLNRIYFIIVILDNLKISPWEVSASDYKNTIVDQFDYFAPRYPL